VIELRQSGDGADVCLHRAVGVATELEVLDHACSELGHTILSDKGREDETRSDSPDQ
jgi:hypothetical protein